MLAWVCNRKDAGIIMKIVSQLKRVMVFIDETDRWQGKNLGAAIAERLKKEGCAGVTIVRGSLGFGSHGEIHTTSILDLSSDLPMIVIVIDEPERIEQYLPIFDLMITEGLVLIDDVEATKYSRAKSH